MCKAIFKGNKYIVHFVNFCLDMKNIYEIYSKIHNNHRNQFELLLWNIWMSLELIQRFVYKMMNNKF